MSVHPPQSVPPARPLARLAASRSRAVIALFGIAAIGTALIAAWGSDLAISGEYHHLSSIFFILFAIHDVRASMWLEIATILALLVAPFVDGDRVARWVGDHRIAIAVATTLLLCAGTLVVYLDHPTSMDEYAQVFQSRIFARGRLAGQYPVDLLDHLVAPVFQNYFLSVSKATGEVASAYWPSFALLLAPFSALGMSWALNPLLSALTLLAIHRLAWRVLGDARAGGWALLFTLASPVFLGNGISYYTMPAHLLANTVFALLLLDPTPRRAFLAGLVGSVALTLHNPVPHLLFAIPWVVWTGRRAGGFRHLGWMALGYLPLCVLLGLGWFAFTNALRASGVPAEHAGSGLAAFRKLLEVFSLPRSDLLFARAVGLAKVWLWAMPGLLVLAIAGGARVWRQPAVRVLAASAVLMLLGYLLVPVDQGHGWGYRYFHPAWMVLPVLAAAAMQDQARNPRWWQVDGPRMRAFVAAAALASLAVVVPARAWQMHDVVAELASGQPSCAGPDTTHRRVVLIYGFRMYYGGDLVQNDPWLRGREIRMLGRGTEADDEMMARSMPGFRKVCQDRAGSIWQERGPDRGP